jgi:hypothetical protein
MMAIPPEDRKRLEDMGEARVRLEFNTKAFGKSALQIFAAEWLAELDERDRKHAEALQAEQMRLMVEQTRLTKSANKAAWVAACVAIGAALVALLAWIHPIH